ncbi:MAG TPA: methyltransferase domain-containing protein [Elusimicrobiota bacterium]|nr:methyltransferase domain-containing protein [Elusimicrobiota bacterium]
MIDRRLNYGRHQIRKFLAAAPFHTVLDLGAGAGEDLLMAREVDPSAELHAVEIEPSFVRQLRGCGIRTHEVDIETGRCPFPDGSLDVVIANQVLEHAKEIFWIAHEVSRVLAVGGRFIVGVPNLASLHNRFLLALGRQPTPIQNNSAHIRGYTRNDLCRFLESAFPGGYALRAWGGSNFYPFPPFLAKPLAALFPNMAWGVFLHFEKKKPYRRQFLEFPITQNLQTKFFLGDGPAEGGKG